MNTATVAHQLADRGGVLGSLARSFKVWQRNRDAFFRVWKTELGGVVAEPLLVLTAVGLGMGTYIGDIGGRSYTEFVAAGLLASYAMFGATFECTFGTYMRMETRRLFQGILATPVSVNELVLGELFWAATRSLMHATVLLTVSFAFRPHPIAVCPLGPARLHPNRPHVWLTGHARRLCGALDQQPHQLLHSLCCAHVLLQRRFLSRGRTP